MRYTQVNNFSVLYDVWTFSWVQQVPEGIEFLVKGHNTTHENWQALTGNKNSTHPLIITSEI